MQATLDTDIIDLLATAVAAKVRPAIPLEIAQWDIATIAAHLNRSESQVRERVACLPDFAKAIRLPSASAARGHALYKAKEVIAWATKYQDRHQIWGLRKADTQRFHAFRRAVARTVTS
jgi:hypothetical protein